MIRLSLRISFSQLALFQTARRSSHSYLKRVPPGKSRLWVRNAKTSDVILATYHQILSREKVSPLCPSFPFILTFCHRKSHSFLAFVSSSMGTIRSEKIPQHRFLAKLKNWDALSILQDSLSCSTQTPQLPSQPRTERERELIRRYEDLNDSSVDNARVIEAFACHYLQFHITHSLLSTTCRENEFEYHYFSTFRIQSPTKNEL